MSTSRNRLKQANAALAGTRGVETILDKSDEIKEIIEKKNDYNEVPVKRTPDSYRQKESTPKKTAKRDETLKIAGFKISEENHSYLRWRSGQLGMSIQNFFEKIITETNKKVESKKYTFNSKEIIEQAKKSATRTKGFSVYTKESLIKSAKIDAAYLHVGYQVYLDMAITLYRLKDKEWNSYI